VLDNEDDPEVTIGRGVVVKANDNGFTEPKVTMIVVVPRVLQSFQPAAHIYSFSTVSLPFSMATCLLGYT
jgi:hypothetical protein